MNKLLFGKNMENIEKHRNILGPWIMIKKKLFSIWTKLRFNINSFKGKNSKGDEKNTTLDK